MTSESALTGSSGKIIFTSQMPLELNNLTIGTDARDGRGGDIEINAPSLTLTNSQITTTTSGQGNAGNIDIISTGLLSMTDNSQLNASTAGNGNGGTITIQTDSINLSQNSEISANVKKQAGGNGGEITIGARSLFLTDQATISATTQGSSNAGKISITNDSLQINHQAQISASTSGKGNAGNVTINGRDTLILQGGGLISSAVRESGQGNGGILQITSPQINLRDNAKIEVNNSSTTQQSSAGIISLQTDSLKVNNASIVAQTANGNGGEIKITTGNLLLRNNSLISATAGSTENPGNGGIIDINAKGGFVIAVSSENSDITANAFGGNGGKINISANRG